MTAPGVIIGQNNFKRVRTYYLTHLGCRQIDCAHALGLSMNAVGRYIVRLRAEWVKR